MVSRVRGARLRMEPWGRRWGLALIDCMVALSILALALPAVLGTLDGGRRKVGQERLRLAMEHLCLDLLEALESLDGRQLLALLPPGRPVRAVHRRPEVSWALAAGRGTKGPADVSTVATLRAVGGSNGLCSLVVEVRWVAAGGGGGVLRIGRLLRVS